MDKIKFSCCIETTDAECPLGLEIWLDDTKIFDQDYVQTSMDFEHELSDLDSEHELKLVMKNKPADYTKVNDANEIIKDACLKISKFSFDEIELGNLISEQTVYTHDFNGHGVPNSDKFYGTMGCNGTVSLKFSTPIYLWLLEHM